MLFVPFNAVFAIAFDVNLVDFNVIVVNFLSPLKAPVPMVFKPVDWIVTVFNFVQFLNAFFPIVITFIPTVTLVSFLLFAKALAATLDTLYVTPLILTVSGTLTLVAFLLVDFV